MISELEAQLEPLYPSASRHGFSVEKLLAEGVAFFLLRADGMPAGCGGIQWVDSEYGEIKRMYVRPQFRGSGFGKSMLNHLADYARSQDITLLRLETGIHQREAIALYERMGFYHNSSVRPLYRRPTQPVLREEAHMKVSKHEGKAMPERVH